MAVRKEKLKAPEFPVPQNVEDANCFVEGIGYYQRRRAQIETAMNDEMALVKKRYEESAAPLKEQIQGRLEGLSIYCAANRDALTHEGKVKFHRFAAGEVSWRLRPPSVAIRSVVGVLSALKHLGLRRFIRTKEEIDKEAMLADAAVANTVSGVKVASAGEDFVVTPFETKLEEVLA
jgi:phage host-nuclease inhibitor protein Gam